MSDYREEQNAKYIQKTLELLEGLPDFCTRFYDGRQMRLAAKSQWSYANKMKGFLSFLHNHVPEYADKEIKAFTLDDLAGITPEQAQNFASYLNNKHPYPGTLKNNKKSTADNYISCISAYYSYFIRNRAPLSDGTYFSFNPFLTIDRMKREHKAPVYMDVQEQEQFLYAASSGDGLTEKQAARHDKNELRDFTICALLLDTGMRISELIGIDTTDINFGKCCIYVVRKGNKEDTVYFSDDTKGILMRYLPFRQSMYMPDKDNHALFLSRYSGKANRISVRAVEKMVKRYAIASAIPQGHKITPHKLRSSFAMEALHATGNFALVKKYLGHDSAEATNIYAQAVDEDKAANRNFRQVNTPPGWSRGICGTSGEKPTGRGYAPPCYGVIPRE